VTNSALRTRSRQASWLFLLCAVGLVISLFLIALVQGDRRQATRGIDPTLPEPIYGAGVSPLCVNVALHRLPEPNATALDQTLDRIGAAGFDWVRQTFPWAAIEPAPGAYDWEPWDALVQAITDHPTGLALIAVLDTAPAWASGVPTEEWDATPPANPTDLARFAATFAARYGERIDVYQIWDEPNLSSHWGGRDVNPAGYATLLQAAAEAIRAADADGQATIVLAGLAPTIETGPRNVSELRYLSDLYDLGAAPYFDIVAGKPYGFDTDASDRRLGEAVLNFSRLVLLRESMVAHGDSDKAVWASHWGWNALPPDWTGKPSIWGQTDETTQADHTIAALERARREWPWAGALCLENWQPDAPLDDPRWGFALISQDGKPRPVYQAIKTWASTNSAPTNPPGYYSASIIERGEVGPAVGGVADYQGEWRFSDLGADVTDAGDQSVTIPFEGTDLGLRGRRGDYRAYLFVSIDGQPANALPHDGNTAYLVLSSPDGQPQVTTIPVARGLDDSPHIAYITVERGWGQWPLVGWSVGWWPYADERGHRRLLAGLGLLALACGVGALWSARQIHWRGAGRMLAATWRGLNDAAQVAVTATVTFTFWASAWLTWGQARAAGTGGLIATIATATLFYISPIFILSLLSLGLLAVLIILRLDLGLALVAFAAPFYLQSREMFVRAFSVVEIAVFLCLISWLIHQVLRARHRHGQYTMRLSLLSLDWAMLSFVAVAFASLFVAEAQGVALREFRVIVLEPALLYLMLRTTRLDRQARWRIVDAFVLGAVGVALVGLYQYIFTADIITAEAGLRRLKSVYGSPNNVGLYLGRALPVLVAMMLFGQHRRRRWLYGVGVLFVAPAILLSFSKGALLFGVPASLLALGVLAGGRWLWATLAMLVAAALAAIPVLRTPRFTSVFDFQSGTSFFRLNLWRSTLDMIREHLWLGVGLDNFLYAYRGRYIRPEAWQEPNLSHPHNILLDYWSRLGVLGLATGLWMQAAFWRLALPLRRLASPVRLPASLSTGQLASRSAGRGARNLDERALALGLMASMVDFLAHGLVDNSYFLVDLAFAFCLTLALVVGLTEQGEMVPRPDQGD
jgi:O-antigen ligase